MKKSFLAYAAAAFAALSCSSVSQLQTQVYDDGVYSRPVPVRETVLATTETELDNLLAENMDLLSSQRKSDQEDILMNCTTYERFVLLESMKEIKRVLRKGESFHSWDK